jgi:circadian clock protein KaiB
MDDYKLKLYVVGHTPHGERALSNLRRICAERMDNRCTLQVVDVLEEPELASDARIIATPTLVREDPLPSRRVIGDLSDVDQVIAGLDLVPMSTGDNL